MTVPMKLHVRVSQDSNLVFIAAFAGTVGMLWLSNYRDLSVHVVIPSVINTLTVNVPCQ
jgi:hypothetical protein